MNFIAQITNNQIKLPFSE